MEQAENGNFKRKTLTEQARTIELASFICFVVTLVIAGALTLGTTIQDLTFALIAQSAILYVGGLKTGKYEFVSASWISLGTSFIAALIFARSITSLALLFASVAVLLAVYEFNHFAFVVQKRPDVVESLDMASARKYERVIRGHTVSTLLVICASLLLSILLAIFSGNLLLLPEFPVLGIAIFAFLAVILLGVLINEPS